MSIGLKGLIKAHFVFFCDSIVFILALTLIGFNNIIHKLKLVFVVFNTKIAAKSLFCKNSEVEKLKFRVFPGGKHFFSDRCIVVVFFLYKVV